jgi:hypothetical protein
VFTSGAVALNFHYNLPDIAKPVINKLALTKIVSGTTINYFFSESKLRKLLRSCFISLWHVCVQATLVMLLSLWVIFLGYFGVIWLVTLNWQTYTGIAGGWGGSVENRHFYAVIIQLFIMLFPVFDMLSVFPLVAITLGSISRNIK